MGFGMRVIKAEKTLSVRFCLTCEDFTTFKYDKAINHSRCENCGNTLGLTNKRIKVTD